MRQESNRRKSSVKGENLQISNSRAMGVITLIALLFVFQVVTFIMQKVRGGVEQVQTQEVPCRFGFNPNTISSDSLQMLGFSLRQAQTILNYRSKGGTFRVKGDFARMYVVDSVLYAQLAPYILLPDTLMRKNVQKKVERSTNQGGQWKKVQEIAENSTNLGGQRKKVQETGESVYGEKVVGNRYVCNLNRADSAALVELYGIGGYYARKILLYRESLGGSFASERQLLEIEGFGQERFSKIENNVVVLKEDIKKFSLLDAGKEFLERHPYIGPYAARGILTYIRIKGRESFESNFQLLEELVKEHVITENNAQRIREYLLHL